MELTKKVLVITDKQNIYFGTLCDDIVKNCLHNVHRVYGVNSDMLCTKLLHNKGYGTKVSHIIDTLILKDIQRIIDATTLNETQFVEIETDDNLNNCFEGIPYNTIDIQSINNNEVIEVDNKAFIVYQQRGRVYRGALVNADLSLTDCYSITIGDTCAFGKNLHEAYNNVRDKILSQKAGIHKNLDYASYVVTKYPDIDEEVKVLELLELHNIITNSCSKGILEFCREHNIDINGTSTMRYFLTITKDAYKPEIIQEIAKKYGVEI